MIGKLQAIKNSKKTRNSIIEKAVSAGFSVAVVSPLLDFLIEELSEAPQLVQSNLIENGPLKLNLGMKEVSYYGKPISLTRKEFQLLEYFARNPNKVLPNKAIAQNVWGLPPYSVSEVANQYIRVYISQLRQKISPDIIKTKPWEGYYLPLV